MSKKIEKPELPKNDDITALANDLAKTFKFEDGIVIPAADIYTHGISAKEAESLKEANNRVDSHDAVRIPAIHLGYGMAVLELMASGGLDKTGSHVTKIKLTDTRTMTASVTGVTEGDDGESAEYGNSRVHITTKHTGTRGSTGMAHAFEALADMAAAHFGPAKEDTN